MTTQAESMRRYREDLATIEREFELDVIEVNAEAAKQHRQAMERRERKIEEARKRYAGANGKSEASPDCVGCRQLANLGYSLEQIDQAHREANTSAVLHG